MCTYCVRSPHTLVQMSVMFSLPIAYINAGSYILYNIRVSYAKSNISITLHLYYECGRNDVVSLMMEGHIIIPLMLSLVEFTHIILLSWKGLSNRSNTVESRTFNISCTPLTNRSI